VHGRAPAFGGADGHAYTVAPFVDEAPDAYGRFRAALLFIRWESERPVGHLETDYLFQASTREAALQPVLALSLADVKHHLDHCIGRGA